MMIRIEPRHIGIFIRDGDQLRNYEREDDLSDPNIEIRIIALSLRWSYDTGHHGEDGWIYYVDTGIIEPGKVSAEYDHCGHVIFKIKKQRNKPYVTTRDQVREALAQWI